MSESDKNSKISDWWKNPYVEMPAKADKEKEELLIRNVIRSENADGIELAKAEKIDARGIENGK